MMRASWGPNHHHDADNLNVLLFFILMLFLMTRAGNMEVRFTSLAISRILLPQQNMQMWAHNNKQDCRSVFKHTTHSSTLLTSICKVSHRKVGDLIGCKKVEEKTFGSKNWKKKFKKLPKFCFSHMHSSCRCLYLMTWWQLIGWLRPHQYSVFAQWVWILLARLSSWSFIANCHKHTHTLWQVESDIGANMDGWWLNRLAVIISHQTELGLILIEEESWFQDRRRREWGKNSHLTAKFQLSLYEWRRRTFCLTPAPPRWPSYKLCWIMSHLYTYSQSHNHRHTRLMTSFPSSREIDKVLPGIWTQCLNWTSHSSRSSQGKALLLLLFIRAAIFPNGSLNLDLLLLFLEKRCLYHDCTNTHTHSLWWWLFKLIIIIQWKGLLSRFLCTNHWDHWGGSLSL